MVPFRLACQRFAWNGRKCKHQPGRISLKSAAIPRWFEARQGASELAPFHSAPLRGLEEERPLGCLLETRKNSIARKFRCRFEFDRSNAKTHCFANFLDVR